MAELAPSIIAAGFEELGEQLSLVEPHATRWHVDVMDGHYVPNLTIGPMVVEAIARASTLPQDVHMMVSNPDATWEWYADAGAARIAFHPDASDDPLALAARIADAGIGPGIAVNPDVEAASVKALLPAVDHLVVMSVYPGFSGQAFIADVLPKIGQIKTWSPDTVVIVDGGVSPDTAGACLEAGADILVSASAIFGAPAPGDVARTLAGLAGGR